MNQFELSIITPTYNRGYILNQLYESLCRQTLKSFEWIIVDDGSKDNTEELVKLWICNCNCFEIKYFKQENGGKHRALNRGIPLAKYDYIYIIDSDDYMTDDAVEKIYRWIKTIEDKKKFAGVSGLRGNKDGRILGQYPKGKLYIDATNLERKKYRLLGDKAEVYRKDLLLKYNFPEFEGETFLGEDAVWNNIAGDGYKIRWFGEVICICEYLNDGLTKNLNNNIKINNFNGYTYIEKLNVRVKKFPHNLLAIGRYIDIARENNLLLSDVKKMLDINDFMLFGGALMGELRKFIKKYILYKKK